MRIFLEAVMIMSFINLNNMKQFKESQIHSVYFLQSLDSAILPLKVTVTVSMLLTQINNYPLMPSID